MNQSVTNLALARVVFTPAPDDEPLLIQVGVDLIEAEVTVYERPDAERVLAWQRVIDTIGQAHGGTPWEVEVVSGLGIRASHPFDGVTVRVWTALRGDS